MSDLPPFSGEAEAAVLGAFLLTDRVHYAYVVEAGLRAEDFYAARHRTIFESMLALYEDGHPIDVLTVSEHLAARGQVLTGDVDALTASVPAVGNLRRYAEIVKEKSELRALRDMASEVLGLTDGGAPTRDVLAVVERALGGSRTIGSGVRRMGSVLEEETENWQRASRGEKITRGTSSGFRDLDVLTGGLVPGNLIILAARPSMGKSALALNIAEHVALTERLPVALFSPEMSEREVAQRLVCSRGSVRSEDLREGRLDRRKWERVIQTSAEIDVSSLFVDDTTDISVVEVRAKARKVAQTVRGDHERLGLVVVDYLQLLRVDTDPRVRAQSIGDISRGLKVLAGEMGVPVLALAQLSRSVESRSDRRPMLSDLRDSGQIEQDADLVMFIYRDEYYDDKTERPGEADLIVAKQRNGPLGVVPLTFQPEYPRFLTRVERSE